MAKDGAMPETTEVVRLFKSMSTLDDIQRILDKSTEEEIVAIITGINDGEKYWWQEQKRMRNPIPNMSRDRTVTYSMRTFDMYGEKTIFELFADFLLKAVDRFSYLTLYVHDGKYGFRPVFGIRYLNLELKNPYLIKFKEDNFPEKLYEEMIKILYSEENTEKHKQFGLEKIKSLDRYYY